MSTAILVSVALATFCLWFYLWMSRKFRYWKDRGVAHPSVVPVFGNTLPLFMYKYNLGDYLKYIYESFPGRDYVGYYGFTMPHLVVRSPKLLEKILVKDFGYFVDHGLGIDEKKNWIDMSLFNLTGNRWRAVRNKVTPTFTSGKLKVMLEQMVKCGDDMTRYVGQRTGTELDVKDLMIAYSTQVVASVAFGLEVNEWGHESEFRVMGRKVLNFDHSRYLAFLCLFNLPWLGRALNGRITPTDSAEYFSRLILNNFDQRIKNGIQRNDFVQLLLQLKQKGHVEYTAKDPDDAYLGISESASVQSFDVTDKMLIAQAYTFIMAGFDATASSLMYMTYELAKNPKIQERVRKEVRAMKEKHGGFTYDALREMTYFDQCIKEGMRLHPLIGFLLRRCTKKYRLDEKLTLEEGDRVVIPLMALHMDPEYYPDPYKFDPERFAPNAERTPYTYMPFGEGPRMCIGMRFALLQMKYALVRLLDEFQIETGPSTPEKVESKIHTVIIIPKNPVRLTFKKLI